VINFVNFSFALFTPPLGDFQKSTVALATVASLGTPDSPVNHSRATFQIPEGGEFSLYGPWGTGHCPVRQTRVLFGFFCSFVLNPNLDLFIGLC
jgi:hypothetical protein